MQISRVGLALLTTFACVACSGGDDSPEAGAGGALAAGSGGTMAGNGGTGGSGGEGGSAGTGAVPGGTGGTSGDAAGTGAPVGMPDGSVFERPDFPSPVLSQTGRGCAIKNDGTMTCWDDVLVDYRLNVIEGQFDAVYLEQEWLANDLCAHVPRGGYNCFPGNSKIRPPADGEYVQIAVGVDKACGLSADGTVDCWGDPAVTGTPSGTFVQIDGGHDVFCGLKRDGSGACWPESRFNIFPADERFRQIATGGTRTCGITLDHRVVCWGATATPRTSTEPAIVVSVDDNHACAVLEDGRADCFGTFLPSYQGPPTDQRFRVIDAGVFTDCGITTDLHVWCWGNNLPAREMNDGDGNPIVVLDW